MRYTWVRCYPLANVVPTIFENGKLDFYRGKNYLAVDPTVRRSGQG